MTDLLIVVTTHDAGNANDKEHQQGEGCTIVHGVAQHDVLLDDGAKEADVIHRE